MSLIKSISGIRGTIGGPAGDGLTPIDIVKFTAAFATFISRTTTRATRSIVVGRDARISGPMVRDLVVGTLVGMGFDVIDIDLASTPTTELAVVGENACGGLILTASHNPRQWNALKLLNERGEFLDAEEGRQVLELAESDALDFAPVDALGHVYVNTTWNRRHIEQVLALPLVDVDAIRKAGFKVAVDAVNSVGGVIVPELLRALGVADVVELNCT
ncbi:MAG: phosphoglucosamine mutase, partial [Muribaculaceae bacterium]|nr:phosphoglucosamine mutase [Muribaculaceae bacterium]